MVAGREQPPLRQIKGFGAGFVLSRTRAILGFCLPSRLAPSPSMGDIPADPRAVHSWSESPSPSEEERDSSEPAAAPQSPRALPLLPEAASEIPADTGSEEQPSDRPDGESSSSWGEQRLSLATPQPEGFLEQGQEFPLLEVSGSGEIPSSYMAWDCLAVTGCACGWGTLTLQLPGDSHGLRAPSTAVGAVGVLAGMGGSLSSLCQL